MHRPKDDRFQRLRQVGSERARRLERPGFDRPQELAILMVLVREPQRETDVEHHAEGVLVARRPDLAVDLLGREVLRRSQDLSLARQIVGRRRLRNAEVEDLHLAAGLRLGEEDVPRLEVAMNDPDPVAGAQRGADARA